MMALGLRFLLVTVFCQSAVTSSEPYVPQGDTCRDVTEYYQRNLRVCCRKCRPGYYAERRCTRQMDTSCTPCPPGEYTEFWNYIKECKLCQTCDQRRGLVVSVNCTTTVKTKCECRSGYHCAQETDCTECEAHSLCPPGQEVAEPGTPTEDTKCRVCPPGTFQKQISLEKCRQHENCTARRLTEMRAGSPESDAVCEDPEPIPTRAPPLTRARSTVDNGQLTKPVDPPPNNSYLLMIVIAMIILCLCVFLVGLTLHIRSRKRNIGRKGNTDTQVAGEVDRASLESKLPLLSSKQPSPPPHSPVLASSLGGAGCGEAQGRLEVDYLTQRSAGDWGESRTRVNMAAHCHSPGAGLGLDGESRGGTHSQAPPPPNPDPRPGGQTRPSGHAEVFGAHGLVGLQGCHVGSFESQLTVNGPLYIYNGQPFPGQHPAEQPEQRRGERGPETGSAPDRAGEAPAPEETRRGPVRAPIPEEDSGCLTKAVQERGAVPEYGYGGAQLVSAQQEDGKDCQRPTQEEPPLRRNGGEREPIGSGLSIVVDLPPYGKQ